MRAEQSTGADALQPPLRSGFRARLSASVRWPARRVAGEGQCPSARVGAGAQGAWHLRRTSGAYGLCRAPWDRGGVPKARRVTPTEHPLAEKPSPVPELDDICQWRYGNRGQYIAKVTRTAREMLQFSFVPLTRIDGSRLRFECLVML